MCVYPIDNNIRIMNNNNNNKLYPSLNQNVIIIIIKARYKKNENL